MILRFIEFLGLGIWLGSDIFLSFVVAPGAFRVLSSRDSAGMIVGYSLTRMHILGIVCGLMVLLARAMRFRDANALISGASLCVLVMLALTAVSQIFVSPQMAALRMRMGSIQATVEGNPLLAQFAKLHQMSVALESGVLLAGFAAMFWMTKELGR